MPITDQLSQPAKGKDINKIINNKLVIGKDRLLKLNTDIIIINNTVLYKNGKFAMLNEKEKTITIDRQKALDGNGLNPLLAHPNYLPNYTYIIKDNVNEHIIKIDSKGRRIKYTSTLNYLPTLKGFRSSAETNEQTKSKKYADEEGHVDTPKKLKDQGGHVVARINGGLPEVINIIPQAYVINYGSDWKTMEKTINKALKEGLSVFQETTLKYKNSRRPISYVVKITIHGKTTSYKFNNTNK